MSYADLSVEKMYHEFDKAKGFIKLSKDGSVSLVNELPEGVLPSVTFDTIYGEIAPAFKETLESLVSQTSPYPLVSLILNISSCDDFVEITPVYEHQVQEQADYFEDSWYRGNFAIDRIFVSEETAYFFRVISDIEERESFYALQGRPTKDIYAEEKVATSSMIHVAKKLLDEHSDLISQLNKTSDFCPIITHAGVSTELNHTFLVGITANESFMEKYYPKLFTQRKHFSEVIEFIDSLPEIDRIQVYLDLILRFEAVDHPSLEGTNMAYGHDTDVAIPDGKPIELYDVANPYEYLREFLKHDLVETAIKYLHEEALYDWSIHISIACNLLDMLQKVGFTPYAYDEAEVLEVNGEVIVINNATLINNRGFHIILGDCYEISYNLLTNEIVYATLSN